jgi:formylglycine-generating enzyme required for sulfatase activity
LVTSATIPLAPIRFTSPPVSTIDDADVQPDLPPGPRAAIGAAGAAADRAIRRAVAEARRAGSPADEPLDPLDDDALVAPLSDDGGDARYAGGGPDAADARAGPDGPLPSVHGYDLVAEVGSGGQAVVYEAVQAATGRRVAIKVLPGGRFAGSRQRERFERETAVLASVQHPNVVGIIDRGRTPDGSFYFVMPFVGGAELDGHVAARRAAGGFGVRGVLRLFAAVAGAVAEAHRLGVVHRDLKPSNVRVDDRGNPYVLDFGLARPRADLGADDWRARTVTSDGQIVGSLPWASPEQAAGDRGLDVRSDVYSLGVMLYQALTGEFPYGVRGPVRQVLENIVSAVPEPPSRRRGATAGACPDDPRDAADGVWDGVDAVVMRCLAKRPGDRYASARALADDLDGLLAARPIAARLVVPPGPPPGRPSWWWAGTRGGPVARAALAATVCLGVAGGLWAGWRTVAGPPAVTVIDLPAIRNSAGMRLVRVPAGSFVMGSPQSESGRDPGERQATVTVGTAFYIADTEVTRRQFRDVMGRDPGGPAARPAAPAPAADDRLPATPVSWDEAQELCRRLSAREPGRTYRLPSEAEWEYACRAGTAGPFGGTGRSDDMGWHAGNSGGALKPVGGKSPNHWGLFDMHGGAEEWCAGVYATAGPANVADAAGGGATSPRLAFQNVRGGTVGRPRDQCRSAARSGYRPGVGGPFTGVRPACD